MKVCAVTFAPPVAFASTLLVIEFLVKEAPPATASAPDPAIASDLIVGVDSASICTLPFWAVTIAPPTLARTRPLLASSLPMVLNASEAATAAVPDEPAAAPARDSLRDT